MSLDTLTYSHKTCGPHLHFPPHPICSAILAKVVHHGQCLPGEEHPILSAWRWQVYTSVKKIIFKESSCKAASNDSFSQHVTPESEIRKCAYEKCDIILPKCFPLLVKGTFVYYLSVGRSTRWWQWGHRWRWKPEVPERHLSLHMVLHCESPPLHRDLRKNKRDK